MQRSMKPWAYLGTLENFLGTHI